MPIAKDGHEDTPHVAGTTESKPLLGPVVYVPLGLIVLFAVGVLIYALTAG